MNCAQHRPRRGRGRNSLRPYLFTRKDAEPKNHHWEGIMAMADTQQPALLEVDELDESTTVGAVEGRGRGGKKAKKAKKEKEQLTSKQQLSSIIKSVRDLLRKDAELSREVMLGDAFEPLIDEPYRWRDWAAVEDKKERKTGDELLEFVNNEL